MVLQRNMPVKIWGWADVDEKVTVRFNRGDFKTIPDANGKWFVTLPAQREGGPYTMEIAGKNKITLENILIGDVWVCGGQSNMEWTFDRLSGKYDKEVATSANSKIRLITIDQVKSFSPLEDISTSGWEEASPKVLPKFSAVAYFFGREIFDKYKVPIGLISDNWGGTYAEAWTSEEGLKKFPEILKAKKYLMDNRETFQRQFSEWNKLVGTQVQDSYTDTLQQDWKEDFSKWKNLTVPGHWKDTALSNFDGVVWLKKEVEIPQSLAQRDLTLYLGSIDDNDITYFNGNKLGETIGFTMGRNYKVPGKFVKAGRNVITVRVTDYYLSGGMTGNASDLKISGEGIEIPIAGIWKYKKSIPFTIPNQPGSGDSPNVPTVLFNGMVSPIKSYGIKGVIWYQGEANASNAFEYRSIFPNMIHDWRKHWEIGEFPFVYVQLANFMAPSDHPTNSEWAELREAQTMALTLPNTAMAVTIDIGEALDIHPKNKLDVGKRLALGAMKVAYKENIVHSGPLYSHMKLEGNSISLYFHHIGSGLHIKNGTELKEFTIAGADQKFLKATAIVDGNTIVVKSVEITAPVAVRYAWADNPVNANLYNKEGLPASPFRTDSWKGITQRK
jgi:sialate O-acetylesterase